ncbi:MAG: sigma-70 family RNA polymerase sigma factor [Clostridiales Family XIII bacterium]|jgi:RNA polymerase sporulation-specific sigma factor|nr:sigma-70 family RNA polymerase sigma factor [Clostridiales Family XIII bacterium]
MSRAYEKFSHEKLAALARGGDEAALNLLFREYRDTIKGKASLYFLAGGETGDLVQEGMIGLFHAITDYDASKEASFRTYAELLIARQMITAIRSAARLKHSPLNTSLSLDAGPGEAVKDHDQGPSTPNGSILGSTLSSSLASPEEAVLLKDEMERLEAESVRRFSKLELDVWREYRKGMSYTDIAKALDRSSKAIDNAIQRMKKKVARAFEDISALF